MTQVVDMLEFTTLKEHDPSVEPIVVLGCGHAYTISTLDGFIGLSSAYKKHEQSGEWVAPLPLESDCSKLKLCPDCRAPVSGVSRYNRITNKAKMDMAEVKHSEWCREEIRLAQTDLAVATADGVEPAVRSKRLRQAEGTLHRVLQTSQETPSTRVYEAATAALKRAGATPQELAAISRLQPDRSVRVKAMAGLGRVRIVQLEALRLQLAKVIASLQRSARAPQSDPTGIARRMDARRPPTRISTADDTRRVAALSRANALEARASEAYRQGVGMLTAAVKDAEATRSTAAGAEAKMVLVHLHLQGAQGILVSKELSVLRPESLGSDTGSLTEIGRKMVQQGLAACKEVVDCSLASVRQKHEDDAQTSFENLTRLDEALRGLTEEEVKMVMAVAADPGLSGGVTKYYRCRNGHSYGVGDCGMLNQGGVCPECGDTIGGRGYH
ncbi:unnamed protein product [Scytosiphon promiscuus]